MWMHILKKDYSKLQDTRFYHLQSLTWHAFKNFPNCIKAFDTEMPLQYYILIKKKVINVPATVHLKWKITIKYDKKPQLKEVVIANIHS